MRYEYSDGSTVSPQFEKGTQMSKRSVGSRCFLTAVLTAVLVVSLTGCGRETINIPDTTPPYVLSTVPAQGAPGAALNTPISATFSKAVASSTVSASTFTVSGPNGPITGAVALSGNTATFTPASTLTQDTDYTATITTGVRDLAGNALVQNYVWHFEIVEVPSVVSTSPANSATGVAVNQIISANFLQDQDSSTASLDCSTLTAGTFTVTSSAGPLPGTVTCSGSTATFTPAGLLAQNATYTATLTTGIKNGAGSSLPSSFVWTFTTGVQPVVISTSPANGATGVLLNQNITALFSKTINCATLYAPLNPFTVTGPGGAVIAGTVSCTGNGAIFSPVALLAPNTLYTATITAGLSDLQGEPLASNFVWSFKTVPAPTAPTVIATNPVNNATGVPINQKIAATFSEAINPATINATTFTVSGPGGVAVAGAVTYVAAGSIATFTPTSALAPNTTYVATITTGAQDLAQPPNVLGANFVSTFTTGAAPDTTKPTVISIVPANAAPGVPINQAVSATFSKAMDPLTINSTSFTVTGPGGVPIAGLVTYAAIGKTATFTPTVSLSPSTLFTATITTGAKDLAGNALASNFVSTFTTSAAPDTTKPIVVFTVAANGTVNVPINQAVSATFSKAIDPLTINATTFTLTGPGGAQIAGTVSYDAINFIATLTPTSSLAPSTLYTATITTGAADLAGNPLGPGIIPNSWSFTTGAVASLPPVPLGTAAVFGGFGGGAGMTNQGTSTVVNGSIGTTGVSTLITGFHDSGPGCTYTETPLNIGFVNGAIDTAAPPPTVSCPNEGTAVTAAVAAKAAQDALAAYAALVAFPGGLDVSTCPGCGGGAAGELGNRTLAPGIYTSAPGSYGITQGDLTLDAKGDPNAFWVFQMGTTLTVGTPVAHRNVLLVNGAQAKNVFWQVGTAATINGILGGGTMSGTIISQAGVSVSTAGVAAITIINGRAIALAGPITIVNTVINVPAP